MQTQMLISIGLSTALAAVVGGALYLGGDEPAQPPHPSGEESAALGQSRPQDPFLQEYQELERLLEETRAQRKQQQVKQQRR
jgi:hypothetical protein